MSAPSLSTEAGLAGSYPALRFNARERVLLSSVKTYVDANSSTALANKSVIIGNGSGLEAAVDTTVGSSASKIRGVVNSATFTVTIASPGVVTSTAHGLLNGDAVVLSTTGALPTGLAAATTYYVVSKATDTFQLSATYGGSAINTSGTQSGVHTFASSGLSLAPLSVGNADIAAAAAISFSKLAALASANILVGSSGGVATSVAMSGDISIDNTGATAIGAGKVLKAMLGSGIQPSHIVVYAGSQVATVGGSATEAKTVTGVLATDVLYVNLSVKGATPRTILTAIPSSNTITITFSGDPSSDHKYDYSVMRATS